MSGARVTCALAIAAGFTIAYRAGRYGVVTPWCAFLPCPSVSVALQTVGRLCALRLA